MIFKVYPHKIEREETSLVNEKEINVNECEFIFDAEIPEEYVKEALFTFGEDTYKVILDNNKCYIPNEVLEEQGTIEIGLVAYEIAGSEFVKRYNPSPVYVSSMIGSLKDAKNTQPITPSDKEQYEQLIQQGLNDINNAIENASKLDIEAVKENHIATITITKQDGTTEEVEITDGEKGDKGDKGDAGQNGKDGIDGKDGQNGKDGINGTDGKDGKDGTNGKDGKDGVDGYSPSASVNKSGSTATITITDKNGTTTTTISDGINGQDGSDGQDGQDGYTPQRGVDYWTSTDIATIEAYIDSKTTGLLTSNY